VLMFVLLAFTNQSQPASLRVRTLIEWLRTIARHGSLLLRPWPNNPRRGNLIHHWQ
jgi:hypothetical protein